ncbi:MAG: hypothetical protein JWM53_2667 [bacterium]|nr:hypothetical protein [bacterium]
MPTIREFLALFLFLATFFQILLVLWTESGRSVGVLLPIAAACFDSTEYVILNLLSLARGVSAIPLATVHLILIATLARYLRRRRPGTYRRFVDVLRLRAASLRFEYMLAPLLILLAVTAYLYPPTNWDSMTYHMARVAHWMQNRSVAYFPANQAAQNTMGPGVEYLLLLLQVLAYSDRWANCVQLFAYVLLIGSLPSLCRHFGLPKRWCPWVAIFVGGIPIITLEATTTQNDLVAALMSVSVVSASLPLLSRSKQIRSHAVIIFSMCAAVTYLVKPTATLAALPISLVVLAVLLKRSIGAPRREVIVALLGAATCVFVVLGPDTYRKLHLTNSVFGGRNEIYPLWGFWKDRAFNSIRAYCQNAYSPNDALALITKWEQALFRGKTSQLFCGAVYSSNEDRAGNPFHALICLALIASIPIVVIIAVARKLSVWRMTTIAATVPFAWVLFHAFIRNQEFITRLQAPIFALSPLLWPAFLLPRLGGAQIRGCMLATASAVALAFGYVNAVMNPFRPPTMPVMHVIDRAAFYYVTHADLRDLHAAALRDIQESTCRLVGFYVDPQHFDYPFTWRAMQMGIAVRPYVKPTLWPCMVFSNLGQPPQDERMEWRPLKHGLWIR